MVISVGYVQHSQRDISEIPAEAIADPEVELRKIIAGQIIQVAAPAGSAAILLPIVVDFTARKPTRGMLVKKVTTQDVKIGFIESERARKSGQRDLFQSLSQIGTGELVRCPDSPLAAEQLVHDQSGRVFLVFKALRSIGRETAVGK